MLDERGRNSTWKKWAWDGPFSSQTINATEVSRVVPTKNYLKLQGVSCPLIHPRGDGHVEFIDHSIKECVGFSNLVSLSS